MKRFILSIIIITALLASCSKEEEAKPRSMASSSTGNTTSTGGGTSSCSTISATNTSSGYKINALIASPTAIGIELISLSGTQITSASINLLQATRGNDCVESTNNVEVTGSFNKYFEVKNLPTWATSSSVVTKVKITINGTSYSLQDLQING